jgi:putative ABC transport system substrate-binding protein
MVESGLAASMAYPGGNVTGITKIAPELTAKRLELLKEMVSTASDVAVIWDPKFSAFEADWRELRSRASTLGVTLLPMEAHVPTDLDKVFTIMASERVDAVLTFSDVLTYSAADRFAKLATEYRLALMSPFRETTKAGGLISYGPSIPDMVRHTAVYLDKIFKGTKPGDLPIEQPTKFEMSINLKTARTLGIEVPTNLLVRADEVIE